MWSRTLTTTNRIESALSVTRRVTARVTRWRDGEMLLRWCLAGLLRAESQFRRVKRHGALPMLIRPWRNPPEHDGPESRAAREDGRRNHLPS
jgi:hypothetical protein